MLLPPLLLLHDIIHGCYSHWGLLRLQQGLWVMTQEGEQLTQLLRWLVHVMWAPLEASKLQTQLAAGAGSQPHRKRIGPSHSW